MKTNCPNADVSEYHVTRENGSCVTCACFDEISRFNTALEGRKIVIDWDSLAKGHTVIGMRQDFWLITTSPSGDRRSWCLCNDGRWARLLAMAGVARNPLFS